MCPGFAAATLQSATRVSSSRGYSSVIKMTQEAYTHAVAHQAHSGLRNPLEQEAPGRPAQTEYTHYTGKHGFRGTLGVSENAGHALMGISLYRPENLQS